MHYDYSPQTSQSYRVKIVAGYSEIIEQHIIDGWQPSFLNFMFNQIPGSASAKMRVMEYEVGRVHTTLMHHVVRWPDRDAWRHLRPIFIGTPDLPVWKHEKELVRNLIVNDGLHYNAVALVPPTRKDISHPLFEKPVYGRQSRLHVPLEDHLWIERRKYHNDVLSRIHVTPITYNTMADYTLKAFKHGRVDGDQITIWN